MRRMAAAVVLVTLAACSSTSHKSSTSTTTAAAPATSVAAPPTTAEGAAPSTLVAILTNHDVVTLDPTTGAQFTKLATSSDYATVTLDRVHHVAYYDSVAHSPSCYALMGTISKVPVTGGTPVMVTSGLAPAVSDDGTRLAYGVATCRGSGDFGMAIHVRDLATGHEQTIADPVPGSSGLPDAPILALSWSADGTKLLLSLGPVQDNEGQGVYVVDVASGQATAVPAQPVVAGQTAEQVFLEPAAFLPAGQVFANLQCCAGAGNNLNPTSNLVIVDSHTGQIVHQVAVGVAANAHTSLRADASGDWLLYVSGSDLEVSRGFDKPTVLAHGVISADW